MIHNADKKRYPFLYIQNIMALYAVIFCAVFGAVLVLYKHITIHTKECQLKQNIGLPVYFDKLGVVLDSMNYIFNNIFPVHTLH